MNNEDQVPKRGKLKLGDPRLPQAQVELNYYHKKLISCRTFTMAAEIFGGEDVGEMEEETGSMVRLPLALGA